MQGQLSIKLGGMTMPLTLQEAQTVITGAHERAAKIAALVTVAIVDEGGHLQALGRMNGAAPLSAQIAETKAASVALFRRDGAALRQMQEGLAWLLRPAGSGRAGAHPGRRRRGAHPAGGHRPRRAGGKRRNDARARRRMRRSRAYCSRSLVQPLTSPDRVLVTERCCHAASGRAVWGFGRGWRSRVAACSASAS